MCEFPNRTGAGWRRPLSISASAVESATVGSLLPLVPPEAGFYKAWGSIESSAAADLIVERLIERQPERARDWRYAPYAVPLEDHAGSEADLKIRVDEQPLPSGATVSDSLAAARTMIKRLAPRTLLLVQSTSTADGSFVQIPSVIVMEGGEDWNLEAVRNSLATAAGNLWTTSQLGAGWAAGMAGRHAIERLDGLGTVMFATRGRLLFLSKDATLLSALLNRVGTSPLAGAFTYATGFRHSRERSNYERIMKALDFSALAGNPGFLQVDRANSEHTFFSGNIASLSHVISRVAEIRVTEEERGTAMVQTALYQIGQ